MIITAYFVCVTGYGKMPAGIQCFDEAGRLTLDLTDRLAKVIGSGLISSLLPGQSTTIIFPGLTNDGSWYVWTTERTVARISNGSFIVTRVDMWTGESASVYWSVVKQ